jgi:endonuclease/exonuclease/phosphatase family metal-dependent hydrolase
MELSVATYNIHKGLSAFGRRMIVHELRDRLRAIEPDVVFLQEVQGLHERRAMRFDQWPEEPQYEFLADSVWPDFAYGRNSVYDHGHHGNAILSRFPIVEAENLDVSSHPFESRGLLHVEIELPDGLPELHCLCVHLALGERGRLRQVAAIVERVAELVPEGAPLVVAGDFNDWRDRAGRRLAGELGLREAFRDRRGRPARSFPSRLPLLRLDRIYVRGLSVRHAEVHHGDVWGRISDHAMLTARLAVD